MHFSALLPGPCSTTSLRIAFMYRSSVLSLACLWKKALINLHVCTHA